MVHLRIAAGALIRAAAAALALAAFAPATVSAQALQRLTVTAFTLTADTANPQLEVPFHLIVTLHVRENAGEIENLDLPILAELELLGDERATRSDPRGTDYRETIAVVAHRTGRIAVAPATLQAIDARDGKPKEYFSNALTLNVTGGSLEPVGPSLAALRGFGVAALRAFAWVLGILCAVAVIGLFLRRRPAPRPVAAAAAVPAAPAPVPRPRSRAEQLSDALTVLRAERSRACAVRVRGAVWRMLGAAEGETLADVLQRPEAREGRMRELLTALERGAFTYDADLSHALDAACDALERYLA